MCRPRVDTRGLPRHWADIGGAFGQRLAFFVDHAPPYPALLGAARAGLIDWATMHAAIAEFPGSLDEATEGPASGWTELIPDASAAAGLGEPPTTAPLIGELADRLARYIERHCPPGQLAATRGAEAGIARACWTLAGWEEAYRAGQLSDDTAKLYRAPNTPTVESLLAAAPGHGVDELTDLAGQLRTSGIIERLRGPATRHPVNDSASPPRSSFHTGPTGICLSGTRCSTARPS